MCVGGVYLFMLMVGVEYPIIQCVMGMPPSICKEVADNLIDDDDVDFATCIVPTVKT